MDAPTYDQIAAGIDHFLFTRGMDTEGVAAKTLAIHRLEEATRLLVKLMDDDVRDLPGLRDIYVAQAGRFIANLTEGNA